jgi:hypothetical protein
VGCKECINISSGQNAKFKEVKVYIVHSPTNALFIKLGKA